MANDRSNIGFAERVKQARSMAGLTQAELADRAGTVSRQVYLYETGGAMPRRTTLERLAHALGTDVDWLLSGEGAPPQLGALEGTVALRKVPLVTWAQVDARALLDEHTRYVPAVTDVSNEAFALQINGTSMASADPSTKSFPFGTIVIFDPLIEVKPGDFVLHLSREDQTLASFRQLVQDGSMLMLRPLNSQFPATIIDPADSICFKAVAAITLL